MRWIDPQAVVVSVRRANEFERASAVRRACNARIQHVHGVHVLRVRKNVMEIPGALRKAMIRIDQLPALAGILAAVDAALFRFDNRVNAVAIRAGNRNANAPKNSARQPLTIQPLPGGAIVAGFIQPAPRPAAGQAPWRALRLPERREQNVRIIRIEHQIDRSGFVVLEQHFLPSLSAVVRTKHPAHLIRTVGVPQRRNVHDVRILRIHDNLRDMSRVFQPDVRPGLSAIHGFVHSIAVRNISANARFARAHVNHVRIRRRHCDRTHGHDPGLVRHRRPRDPAVRRFPGTARHGPEIIGLGIARHAGYREGAPATKWAHLAPFHPLECVFVECLRMQRNNRQSKKARDQQHYAVNRKPLEATHRISP